MLMLRLQTRQEPVINAQVYHNDERLYTLLMVDPGKLLHNFVFQ